MAQISTRYTPDQVLEAGERAEGDGRIDYAIQFYRHLTNYHPGTSEAQAAAAALQRLDGGRATGAPEPPIQFSAALRRSRPDGPRPQLAVTQPLPPPTPQPMPQYAAQHAQRASPPAPQQWHDQDDDDDEHGLPAAVADDSGRATGLPPPVRGYRIGRGIAGLVAILGWLLVLSGIAAMGLGMVVGFDIARVTGYSGIVTGPVLIAIGIAVVFWSQLASAVFATANATRDLAAIERAKASRPPRD